MGTSRVRLFPTDTITMALKPHFSSLCYCSGLHLNLATLSPGDALLKRRLLLAMLCPGDASSWRRFARATPCLGDALSWRRLLLATPCLGDTSSWRRLVLATPSVVNLLTSLLWGPRVVPPYVDFDFGQYPGTGRYTSPPVLS